jgi:hypothetical protein
LAHIGRDGEDASFAKRTGRFLILLASAWILRGNRSPRPRGRNVSGRNAGRPPATPRGCQERRAAAKNAARQPEPAAPFPKTRVVREKRRTSGNDAARLEDSASFSDELARFAAELAEISPKTPRSWEIRA